MTTGNKINQSLYCWIGRSCFNCWTDDPEVFAASHYQQQWGYYYRDEGKKKSGTFRIRGKN